MPKGAIHKYAFCKLLSYFPMKFHKYSLLVRILFKQVKYGAVNSTLTSLFV